ncbi:MAG: phosphoribosylanthranilate isomerase [Sphingomonadales bacterium]
MAIGVKICGLSTPQAIGWARDAGARMAGFVFYPPSPRYVTPAQACGLSAHVPATMARVGVYVDPDDALIDASLAAVDMIQVHNVETPARVAQLRRRAGKPVIVALGVETAADLDAMPAFAPVSDVLLFDAKPPKSDAALPGGNARAFDWGLLAGLDAPRPWLLSGGLTPGNVGQAIDRTGAAMVDVSSGVEQAPGMKDKALIDAFMAACRQMETV